MVKKNGDKKMNADVEMFNTIFYDGKFLKLARILSNLGQ